VNPAALATAALLTDVPAVPARTDRGYWRFVGGASLGMVFPACITPLLFIKVCLAHMI